VGSIAARIGRCVVYKSQLPERIVDKDGVAGCEKQYESVDERPMVW